MFLPDSLTRMTNDFVRNSPAESLPRFKRTGPHVAVGGSILRYSSATPDGSVAVPVPGGYKLLPR